MQMTNLVTGSDFALSVGGCPAGISSSGKYRVLIVREGTGTISVSGRVTEAVPQSILLISPYDLLYIPAETAETVDAYLFTFAPEMLYRTGVSVLDVFDGECCLSPAVFTDAVTALVARLDDLITAPAKHTAPLARLYVTELLLHLSVSPIPQDETLGVARAARYLAAHLHEEVSLDHLSSVVGISKFYLCRAFSRDSGLTPHAYLNHLRAYRAEALLAGGMSAADAAVSVGFGDYSTFFRTYRKIIGRTPTTRESETV